MRISAKIAARITTQLKAYQGILAQAMKKDSSEGDKVSIEDLRSLLMEEVIKRELIDGEEAKSALAHVKKLQRRMNAKRNDSDSEEDVADSSSPPPQAPDLDAANRSTSLSAGASTAIGAIVTPSSTLKS
jgi:hypothetical protein